MCPIPNGFRGRAISLYSSKNVDKKEILRTVSNTGISIVQVTKLVQFT
jgi:predicted RNase H-like nuclease (RuvC/YqgF family)